MTAATSPVPRRRAALGAATLVATLLLGGCGVFGSDKPKPKPLEPLAAPITVRPAWTASIGRVTYPLTLAVFGGAVIAASEDGDIVAFDAADGKVVWRVAAGAKLAAGVGTDGRSVAVVTRDNELLVLQGGKELWRKPVGARVATAPLVAGGRVFVLTVDRAVQAYDGDDGTRLWQVQRPGDPLALTEAGVVTAWRNTLVVGQGPRLAGLDPANGAVRWEAPVGSPRGANEVERLADLVGPPVRNGDVFCARSFGSAVGCIDAARGRPVWTRAVGGRDPIAGDAELLFGADNSDRIAAWKAADGEPAWSSEALLNRRLRAPGTVGSSVVFGDEEGTLHWFARAGGQSQARVTTDGSPLAARPVTVDGTLVVVTRRGGVYAFRPG